MKMQGPNPQGTGISQRIVTFTPINTQYLDWEVQEGPSESSDKRVIVTLTLLACEPRLPQGQKGQTVCKFPPLQRWPGCWARQRVAVVTGWGWGWGGKMGPEHQGQRAAKNLSRGGRRKGSSGRQHYMWAKAPSPQQMLHCPNRLHLQNTTLKIKLVLRQ